MIKISVCDIFFGFCIPVSNLGIEAHEVVPLHLKCFAIRTGMFSNYPKKICIYPNREALKPDFMTLTKANPNIPLSGY